jgi:hypothetical protein
MKLSEPQKRIAYDQARFRVWVGGRRTGKTTLSIRELCHAAREPNKHCWAVFPSYRQAKQVAWVMLKEILHKLRWVKTVNEAELTILLKNNSRISLRGAENYDALRGTKLDLICFDETSDIPEDAWTSVLRPTISDTKGKACFFGTPKGRNWFFDLYQRGQDPTEPEWSSYLVTTKEGGWVDDDELAQAKRDLDHRTFQQEYEGTFLTWSGVIYYALDLKHNVKRFDIPDDVTVLHIGHDFNIDPMVAIVCYIKNDIVYVADEIQIWSSNTDEICQEIHHRYPNKKIFSYPDPSAKQRKTSAGGKTDISILQNNGFIVKAYNKHLPVRDRINSVNSKLCSSSGIRGLIIHPNCKNLLNTLSKQVYKANTSVPDKSSGLDHHGDALGYLVSYLYPITREYTETSNERFVFKTRNRTWQNMV